MPTCHYLYPKNSSKADLNRVTQQGLTFRQLSNEFSCTSGTSKQTPLWRGKPCYKNLTPVYKKEGQSYTTQLNVFSHRLFHFTPSFTSRCNASCKPCQIKEQLWQILPTVQGFKSHLDPCWSWENSMMCPAISLSCKLGYRLLRKSSSSLLRPEGITSDMP